MKYYLSLWLFFGFLFLLMLIIFLLLGRLSRQKRIMKDLEEAKGILEVRIRAKNKQLEELAKILEEEVQKRTKELRARVIELEKFHRLTIGREQKMIELKKEISRLESELRKQKEKEKRL